MKRTKLFLLDAKSKVRVWTIWADGIELVMEYGLEDGTKTVKRERVPFGLGGRTQEQQIQLRMESRINDMIKKGYKETRETALHSRGTNGLGFHKPMLAKPLKNVKNIDFANAFVQHKYDGHRCMITKRNGEMIAYSRQSKLITSINHILENLNLPEGMTIDGELYAHGFPLQTLTSWIKKEQEGSKNLLFHAYDLVADDNYLRRFDMLNNIVGTYSSIVPTMRVHSQEDVSRHFEHSRKEGYEGTIIRWGEEGYHVGKRSQYLVKVKATHDAEFPVTDIISSKDGWAILVCSMGNGATFKVTAPGTMQEKQAVYDHKEGFIGKLITVEYANLTADGVPFHPVALRWREDI